MLAVIQAFDPVQEALGIELGTAVMMTGMVTAMAAAVGETKHGISS
jgi:hypothetical protein